VSRVFDGCLSLRLSFGINSQEQQSFLRRRNLLVEGLGVGGGGRDVGVTGSLVGAGGQLELVGGLEVRAAGLAVGTGVVLKIKKLGEHGG
jgi:hypothetical protein